jgi:serine/threonine-protein kinase
MIGKTLAHYEITAKLGEGGMGEVYRARDGRLGREVAIKVLSESVAGDPERLARFDREARVLAALDHPNIAAIYGLEEAEGRKLLVMQLVEGEDLAERLSRGPLPVKQAISVALQIAEGVAAAHEKGIVHRDLKPANVKVSEDGTVKVLDFGLAKAMEADPQAEGLLTQSPTLTTGASVLLGTAPYMSPEQARGLPVDKRADVWAFGAVLYEMLTARQAFPGETMTDVLAAVVNREPEWALLPAATPPAVRRLLRRALAKDAADRQRDLGDAQLDLLEALSDEPEADPAPRSFAGRRLLAAGLVTGVVLGALLARPWGAPETSTPTPSQPPLRGVVELPESGPLAYGAAPIGFDSPLLALSPDGRWLVYVARKDGDSMLYRHDLTSFEAAEPIEGTEGALHATFAPDGSALAFVTLGRLKRISIDGDNLQTLAEVSASTRTAWVDEGTIVFSDYEGGRISRVPEGGGEVERIRSPVAGAPMNDAIPGGRWILATSRNRGLSADFADIVLLDLERGEGRILIERGYDPRYVPSGHVVFGRAGSLMAIAFDPDSGTVSGEPVTVVPDVAMDSFFAQVQVAVAANGTLAFAPGGERSVGGIGWVDRSGASGDLAVDPRLYGVLDLAPDDRRLVMHVGDVSDFLWLFDMERNEGRVLRGARSAGWPNWSASGESIAYQERDGQGQRVRVLEGMTGADPTARTILDLSGVSPGSWSPDDRTILMHNFREALLTTVEVDGDDIDGANLEWLPASAGGAAFSPDGGWLAYSGEETGIWQVYVRSWPDGEVVRQISTDGGIEPRWCPCGELYYRVGDTFWAVEVKTAPELDWKAPEVAWEADFIDTPGRSYDVSSDGNRLYVVKPVRPDITDRIHVVSNWFDELEERVGGGS